MHGAVPAHFDLNRGGVIPTGAPAEAVMGGLVVNSSANRRYPEKGSSTCCHGRVAGFLPGGSQLVDGGFDGEQCQKSGAVGGVATEQIRARNL